MKAANLRIVASPHVDVSSRACDSLPLVHIDPLLVKDGPCAVTVLTAGQQLEAGRAGQDEAAEIVAQQEAGLLEQLLSSTSIQKSEGLSVSTDKKQLPVD